MVTSQDLTSAILVIPVLAMISFPLLRAAVHNEPDRLLRRLIVVGLALKVGAAFVRYFVISGLYGGQADAAGYHRAGAGIATKLWDLDFDLATEGGSLGTRNLKAITGIVYVLTGPSIIAGFLVFSWIAYWGLYLWFRAVRVAVPDGDGRAYGVLVFLLPSLLFWPSSIGKDAWMTFALGLGAYGIGRAFAGRAFSGLALAGTGLWLAALIRPHVPVMLAVAGLIAYAIRRPPRRFGTMGPVAKGVGVIVLLTFMAVLAVRSTAFFGLDELSGRSVETLFESTEGQTTTGGSAFRAARDVGIGRVLTGTVAVLFRPFPWDAHNLQALVASLESALVLLLVVARFPRVVGAVGAMRRLPFGTFAFAYTLGFSFAFASVGNFGILARQRVQVLPALLVLVIAPRLGRRSTEPAAPSSDPGPAPLGTRTGSSTGSSTRPTPRSC